MSSLNKEQRNAIEAFIDRSSVHDVLDAIEQICYEKAEHIESNWQEATLARLWNRTGNRIGALSAKVRV